MLMSDKISLLGLEIETFIGVHEREQRARQLVSLDLEMDCDCQAAARTDELTQALDYEALAKQVRVFVEANRFQLLERLAEQVAELILAEFPLVQAVSLKATKPGAVDGLRAFCVSIIRSRA